MEIFIKTFVAESPKYLATLLFTIISTAILIIYCRIRLHMQCKHLIKQHSCILSRTKALKIAQSQYSSYIPTIDKGVFVSRLLTYCLILPLSPTEMHNMYYLKQHLKDYDSCVRDLLKNDCGDVKYSFPHSNAVAIFAYAKILSTLNPFKKYCYNIQIRQHKDSLVDFVAKEIDPSAK